MKPSIDSVENLGTNLREYMESEITQIFLQDPRIYYIVHYDEGFVPNSYYYKCNREAKVYYRDGRFGIQSYDAKRSNGRGPTYVGFSIRGGRLFSK